MVAEADDNELRQLSTNGPRLTRKSKEILTYGPISIWFIGKENKGDAGVKVNYEFEVKRGWVPLLWTTASAFTKVFCSGSTPLFVQRGVEIHVEGSGCEIYAVGRITLRGKAAPQMEKLPEDSPRTPSPPLTAIYSARSHLIKERIAVVVTDGMKVYCGGEQRVFIHNPDTRVFLLS